MSASAATSYDEMPYGNPLFSYSHPDRLATVATLLGMQPPAVESCRVLDLGCGTGANILAMAFTLPESRFLGLDLSATQTAMGQQVQRRLGLTNIELRAKSILDVDDSLGQFDYIICHGVYSWVSPNIQDKILSICSRNLVPGGVAYVSYNTYPGWHLRSMVRDMMRFHVKQFADPNQRIEQAWALLDFLIETVGDAGSVYGRILQVEKDVLATAPPTYLYHEHLEESNFPVYFHQFMERAAGKGLQYLSEANFLPLPTGLTPKACATLEQLAGDLIQGEQYLDFVRNRRFRWTLLCHADVPLKRPPSAQAVPTMRVTGVVRPVSPRPDLVSEAAEEFCSPDGGSLTTANPLFKATLCILAEAWPRSLSFGELWNQARGRLPGIAGVPDDPGVLAQTLLQCFLANVVELHLHAPPLVTTISTRPVASPMARLRAETENRLPNLRHRTVELHNDFERQVLLLLDGSRGRMELLADLQKAVADGTLEIRQGEQAVKDTDPLRELLASFLDTTLARFANLALLVG